MSIATFTLKSATTQGAAPFSLGHAFKRGDVPSGSQLVAGIADLQVDPKNVWGDGSLKFAVISGRAALTAATPLSVTLSIGTPAGGTALTTDDLKATGVVAAIDAGAFGAASFETTDWDAPWQSWVSGPKMSSWVYRKQIGSDAHLVAFVEVRLFSGGEVEVLPWIENGYLKVAGPTNKNETYTFTLGGSQRYSGAIDLKHHSRTVLINGAALSYWLGSDPGVTPRHDVEYMQATEMVPSYSASTTALSGLVATYAPLQQGNFTYSGDAMTSSGYQAPIGLLPTHDVAYLVCTTNHELLYGAVLRNGYSVGRYPIHYRDEATNRVPRFSTNSTLVLGSSSGISHTGASTASNYTPVPSGGVTAGWDTAHCPAVGFMAYLLTGHWYHLETMQFSATANYFNITDWLPHTSYRVRLAPVAGATQTRSAAWGFRALMHALTVIPESDTTIRSEFVTLAESIISYFDTHYIAQSNNPFGVIAPGEAYSPVDGKQQIAIWQQDFFTAVYGYAISLDLPITSTVANKLASFFQWKAVSVVMRLGAQGDFWYINAAPYTVAIAQNNTPDYAGGTGPWLADVDAVYAATYFTPPSWMGSTEGTLAGEFTSDNWGKAQWGNLQPAIAYAVRHGVPGAQAGYDRMVNASNFSALQTTFNASPVWSVEPYIPPPTVMGKTIRCDTVSLIPGMIVCGDRGLGVLAADIPTGFDQDSMLLNDIDPSDPEGTEYRVEILTGPSVGTLFVEENGAVTYTPPTPEYEGVATGTQRVWKNGVSQGDTTYSFTNGTLHDLTGAGTTQSATSGAGAITSEAPEVGAHSLTAASCTQTAISGAGVITSEVPASRIFYYDFSAGVNGTGTTAAPYNTWPGTTVIAGDTHLFKRGTTLTTAFTMVAGTLGNVVKYGAWYNADGSDDQSQPKPIVNTTTAFSSYNSNNKNYTWVDSWDIRGNSLPVANDRAVIFAGTGSSVTNCIIDTNIGCLANWSKSDVIYSYNTLRGVSHSTANNNNVLIVSENAMANITIQSNTIRHKGGGGTQSHALRAESTTAAGLTNLRISDNNIGPESGQYCANQSAIGIRISACPNASIADNTVQGMLEGIWFFGGGSPIGCTIAHNTCTYNRHFAIHLTTDARGCMVEHNNCSYNGTEISNGVLQAYGRGIETSSTAGQSRCGGHTFRFNVCTYNFNYGGPLDNGSEGVGIAISDGTDDCRVYGNIIGFNEGTGIQVYGGALGTGTPAITDTGNNVIYANLFESNCTAAFTNRRSGGTLTNNFNAHLAFSATTGTQSIATNNVFVGSTLCGISQNNLCTNVLVANNIFDGVPFPIALDLDPDTALFQHNVYFGATRIYCTTAADGNGEPAFPAKAGYSGTNDFTLDPELDANYRPRSINDAIRNGFNAGIQLTDFGGRLFRPDPSIGMFERTTSKSLNKARRRGRR